MHQYYFSKKENGFFINPEDAPSDIVEISESEWEHLLEGQSEGKLIISNEDGYPILIDLPPPSPAQQIAMAEQQKSALLAEAQSTIGLWQTELQLGIISDDDKASLIAWMKYIQALNVVDTSTAPDIDWPVKPE
ncbi:tail fiber assembly protein [Pantoea sp. B65]|uniref:tail fiber assembly protein n=1 Tax=Pantoea sp. B65 TaxID=2813359 RepID=UPI0039B3CF15